VTSPVYPPRPSDGPLGPLWDKPVSQLVELSVPTWQPAEAERHTIACLLLMALVSYYWNGNKRGAEGTYPWRPKQQKAGGQGYQGGNYLGHNIACLAVNSRGRIIDFDFNHNELLNSSVEHAESRLVRRVFSLTQIYDLAGAGVATTLVPIPYANLLNDVTIYTSLESCSQCSGIMALGSVKEVVFLQRDPGQSSIGNILRNLSPVGGRYRPPVPVPADLLGLQVFAELDRAYSEFAGQVEAKPFHVSPEGKADVSPSITSFLCTDAAMDLFTGGRDEFVAMKSASYPTHQPLEQDGRPLPGALCNKDMLAHAHHFYDYATIMGRRGTPHTL